MQLRKWNTNIAQKIKSRAHYVAKAQIDPIRNKSSQNCCGNTNRAQNSEIGSIVLADVASSHLCVAMLPSYRDMQIDAMVGF